MSQLLIMNFHAELTTLKNLFVSFLFVFIYKYLAFIHGAERNIRVKIYTLHNLIFLRVCVCVCVCSQCGARADSNTRYLGDL